MAANKETLKSFLNTFNLLDPIRSLRSSPKAIRYLCWNAGYRLIGTGDHLPIPPTRLIYKATTGRLVGRFLFSGELCRDSILYALQKNDYSLGNFGAVLDFGCGCGRVMRYWRSVQGPRFYGTDYNSEAIAWDQKNLGTVAEFKTNQLEPPLDYDNEQFDFIYSISVFTHLSEKVQFAWINELARVLKPGGLLLISVHGESRLSGLSPADQRKFRSGQLIVEEISTEGSNSYAAYHPYQYVHDHLAGGFEVLDFIPIGARDADQDFFLLQKPIR